MSLNPQLFPPIPSLPDNPQRPFWSVVIPTYNRPDYLTQCLNSVLAQAIEPEQMQILVVDDCSATPLKDLVQKVGRGRVQYYRNPRNLHNSATFNVGIQKATGQWIHLLHDDDWVLPGFYHKLQQALTQQPAIGAACCRYVNTDEVGNRQWQADLLRPTAGLLRDWLSTIAVGNPLSPPAVVIRRDAYEKVGGYCPNISCGEDWELYKRVAIFFNWWYEPEILACYRQHPASITHNALKQAKRNREIHSTIDLTEPYLPAPLRSELTATARRNYALISLNYALNFLDQGNPQLALGSIQDGLKLSSEPEVLHVLFTRLLVQPGAAPLRQQIVDWLINLDIPLKESVAENGL